MKKFLSLILAGSAIAVATPAMAQDVNSAFTGLRVEGLVGYDSVRPGSTSNIDNVEDLDQSIEDVSYGVGVGFDFATSGVVLGVEGEWMESEASTEYDTDNFTNFGIANAKMGRDLYVGARAGVLVTPSVLAYVKGGYTNAKVDILATDNTTDIGTDLKLDGWRAGAGLEVAVSENIFVKAEYRYSNYSEGTVEFPNGTNTDSFNLDLDRHQGVVGIGLRF